MNYQLHELIDVPKLTNLLDSFDEIHSMPSAIIDTEGKILTATAWQDICTKFHRVHPETEKKCLESTRNIEVGLCSQSPCIIYRCPMGLFNSAIPIILEGKHLGNVFTGQLFLEPPDETYFIEQARRYGFNESDYLAAMRKVPYFSEDKLYKNSIFIHRLTQMLAEQELQYKRKLEVERALRESEEKHRTILQTAMDGFWLVDLEGRLLEVNEVYCRMSGYSAQELLSMRVHDVEAVRNADEIIGCIQRVIQQGEDRFETEHRRKDGTLFFVEISVQSGSKHGGRLVVFLRDITAKRRIGAGLLESKANLKATLEATADGILSVDGNGKIQFHNQRFMELWRIPRHVVDIDDDNILIAYVLDQLGNANLKLTSKEG